MPQALHRRIGQLVVVGFDGYAVPAEVRAIAREFDLGGLILFARNVDSPEQVAEIACEAQQMAAEVPLWVGIDQEGGRVARMRRPLTEWPPAAVLGRADDEALTERFARALATELRAVGISIDFAPVLDVLTTVENPAIGDRALAGRADVVARHGSAIIRTLQACGVAACGKHFPGHGDTRVDSHLDLPVVEHPPDRLAEVELVPFRAAIAADVAAIMTGHLLLPALDDRHPATLSRAIVTGVLRDRLRFDGLVLTDDMDMKAIAARVPPGRAVTMAVAAGCDAALLCGVDCAAHATAIEALVRAVEEEVLPVSRVEEAIARQQRTKARFAAPRPPDALIDGLDALSPLDRRWRPRPAVALRALVGRDSHQAVAEEMRRYA